MQRGFGGRVFEPVEQELDERIPNRMAGRGPDRGDREITLGSVGMLLLGVGLLGLCAVCFGLGYAIGHRSPGEASAAVDPVEQATASSLTGTTQTKPSAAQNSMQPQAQAGSAAPAASDGEAQAARAPEDSGVAVSVPAAQTRTDATAAAGESVVRTALPAQPSTAVGEAIAPGRVATAMPQPAGIMVQIASVAHSEDADVLVSALRKRGYAVSARHDPADGLIHVQVGPFASRTDALAMRQRLLNDGYNAMVQ